MKANELRIGNFINFRDENHLFEIVEINQTGLRVKDNEQETWIEFDCFDSIQLTEEWLLKLGFKKSSLGYFTIFCGSNVMSVYCFQDFSRIQIVSQNVCCIKYIHELQNLYFALTQTELTLS